MWVILFCGMSRPFMEGTVSIGVCGVFPAIHSTSSSASVTAHGAIVAVVAIIHSDGEYARRVFIQTNGDGFNTGGSDCGCSCSFQSLAQEVR
jgi:hypothetical protein